MTGKNLQKGTVLFYSVNRVLIIMLARINVILSAAKNLSTRLRNLALLLFFVLSLTLFASPAFATSTTLIASPSAFSLPTTNYQLPTTIPPTSPLYTDLLVNNMFHSFSCLAIGQSVIGQPCLTYQITKNAQGMIQGVPVLSSVNLSGGTLGAVTSVIGALYMNPPVRTADYLASVGQGLGIVKEAQAQGVTGSGAAVLSPILKLWQVSRNISYVVMIIIFLVIGLMIMFRNRINPQTVITAQTALPGLVIGLILITFSYFLAGLLSDFAFIGTNVVGYYFSAAQGTTQNLVEETKDKNVLSIFSPLTGILNKDDVSDALSSIWQFLETPNKGLLDMDPARALTALTTMLIIQLVMPFGNMVPGIGQVIATLGAGGFAILNPTAAAGLALSFIAMVILIYTMFKLLLRLINNYITIIFLTITAPFQFLAASLPGRQGIVTSWILNMLCNILAFPAVFAAFYFVAYLLGTDNNAVKNLLPAFQISGASTVTGTSSFPLFGGMDLNFIKLLLAFGVLVALPSIPDIICRTIGRMGVAGQLIGQELGAGVGAGRGYAGQFQQGIGGFAGQVGRLRDEPGWIYRNNNWERVTGTTQGLDEIQKVQAGYRPGQWTRFTSGLRGFFGRGRPPRA